MLMMVLMRANLLVYDADGGVGLTPSKLLEFAQYLRGCARQPQALHVLNHWLHWLEKAPESLRITSQRNIAQHRRHLVYKAEFIVRMVLMSEVVVSRRSKPLLLSALDSGCPQICWRVAICFDNHRVPLCLVAETRGRAIPAAAAFLPHHCTGGG